MITKDEFGEDITVFTQEELDAQKEEFLEQYKAENPDKSDEIAALEEELLGLKNKDQNFVALRKAKDDAEKKISDITKEIDDKITLVKKEVMEGVMKDHYNDTLKSLAGEDAEMIKKVEFHFKRLGDVASTKAEISNKLRDAYLLANKNEDGGVDASVFSSGGVGRLNIKNDKKFTQEEKEMGAKFGLTDKDFK